MVQSNLNYKIVDLFSHGYSNLSHILMFLKLVHPSVLLLTKALMPKHRNLDLISGLTLQYLTSHALRQARSDKSSHKMVHFDLGPPIMKNTWLTSVTTVWVSVTVVKEITLWVKKIVSLINNVVWEVFVELLETEVKQFIDQIFRIEQCIEIEWCRATV